MIRQKKKIFFNLIVYGFFCFFFGGGGGEREREGGRERERERENMFMRLKDFILGLKTG